MVSCSKPRQSPDGHGFQKLIRLLPNSLQLSEELRVAKTGEEFHVKYETWLCVPFFEIQPAFEKAYEWPIQKRLRASGLGGWSAVVPMETAESSSFC
jgi:hypothetical protein